MQNYGVRLKEIRVKMNLTQQEIADLLQIKQQAWQRMESGKIPDPRASTITHICKTLNVSSDWLLGLTDTITK